MGIPPGKLTQHNCGKSPFFYGYIYIYIYYFYGHFLKFCWFTREYVKICEHKLDLSTGFARG